MSQPRLFRAGLFALAFAVLALFLLRAGQAQPPRGKKYALLVGVNYYKHSGFKPLRGAENDVEEVAKQLRKQGFLVRLLTTARGHRVPADAPTAANLRRELDTLLSDKGREDTVLIALAGHGAQVAVPHPDDAEKETKRTKSYTYFLPTDANLEKISYSTGYSDRLLELGDLFDRLGTGPKKCGAGAKLVLIDACRDNVQADSSTRSLSPTHVKVPDGVSALFSCGPGEAALETGFPVGAEERRIHGVFFYHVIEGLKGAAANRRGKVNWADLTSYVQDEVPAFVKKLRQRQHPHVVLNAQRTVVLVEAVEREVPKEKPATEKVVKDAREVTNSIGMRLVRIPAGKFMMGSPTGEANQDEDEQQHEVEITKAFYLGVYEVTQEQYEKVMGNNPSHFSAGGGGKDKVEGLDTSQFPVETVSWEEAVEFCRKLSELPAEKKAVRKYRLPTEAEWEYACRGGARSYQTFHFGNSLSSHQANFYGKFPHGGATKGPYLGRTCKVGSYRPNGFGLYDMHGNVCEWCADWYDKDYYAASPRRDPAGPSRGPDRVLRGGGWHSFGGDCRSALRLRNPPGDRDQRNGFRVALVPSGE